MKQNLFRTCLVALTAALCTTLTAATYSVETVPDPKVNGQNCFVSNPDGVIEPVFEEMINNLCIKIEAECTVEIAVVALNEIDQDIFNFSQNLFEHWGIGKHNNNGVLILLSKNAHDVRIHTGYGVEGILPDATCHNIIYTYMIPCFKRDAYGEGLMHGMLYLYEICSHPEAAAEVTDKGGSSASGSDYSSSKSEDSWTDTIWGACIMFFLIMLPFLLMVLYQGKEQKAGDELEQRSGCLNVLIIGCVFMPWLIPTAIWFAFASRKVRCPECGKRKMVKKGETVIKEATYVSGGTKQIECECKACGHKENYTVDVPKLTRSSGGGGGGGHSGGGGSWGGGHSGGGGAGGHW